MSISSGDPAPGGTSSLSEVEERRRTWSRLRFNGPLHARRPAERETLILLTICTLDMLSTLYWVVMGMATEANPLIAWTFNHHPLAFVLVKLASVVPACIFAPRLAINHPVFTAWLLRGIIAVYVGTYVLNLL